MGSSSMFDSTAVLTKVPGLQELSLLLRKRLELPNSATKIVYSRPCNNHNMTGCTDPHCKRPLSSDPLERLRDIIGDPNLTLSNASRELILSIGSFIPENDIIVFASSSNHYDEMQAMFENLHTVVYPLLKNFSVVIFDIRLTKEQRDMTKKKCKCQLVNFPAEIFPEHVKDNHCYSWKPIIIQTFDYMGEEPCTFFPYPELDASMSIHKKDPLTVRAVLEPWTRCALEKSCICPVTPSSVISCAGSKTIHKCHRFDQSALTIILAKLYREDVYRIRTPEDSFVTPKGVVIVRENKKPGYSRNLKI